MSSFFTDILKQTTPNYKFHFILNKHSNKNPVNIANSQQKYRHFVS